MQRNARARARAFVRDARDRAPFGGGRLVHFEYANASGARMKEEYARGVGSVRGAHRADAARDVHDDESKQVGDGGWRDDRKCVVCSRPPDSANTTLQPTSTRASSSSSTTAITKMEQLATTRQTATSTTSPASSSSSSPPPSSSSSSRSSKGEASAPTCNAKSVDQIADSSAKIAQQAPTASAAPSASGKFAAATSAMCRLSGVAGRVSASLVQLSIVLLTSPQKWRSAIAAALATSSARRFGAAPRARRTAFVNARRTLSRRERAKAPLLVIGAASVRSTVSPTLCALQTRQSRPNVFSTNDCRQANLSAVTTSLRFTIVSAAFAVRRGVRAAAACSRRSTHEQSLQPTPAFSRRPLASVLMTRRRSVASTLMRRVARVADLCSTASAATATISTASKTAKATASSVNWTSTRRLRNRLSHLQAAHAAIHF